MLAVLLGSLAHASPASAAACASTTAIAGGDIVLTFSTVGTCEWTVPDWVTSARVLVVAGGGGGGVNNRGGGGAGGMQDLTVNVTPGSTATVVVGAGGIGAKYGPAYINSGQSQDANTIKATNGGDSSFGAVVSVGGGGGGGCWGSAANLASNGGSGGGSAGCTAPGTGTPGQGNDGSAAGGGGGAGAAGNGAVGGAGLSSDITGSVVFYAGGGGGAGNRAAGGVGGGGAAGKYSSGQAVPPLADGFAVAGTDGLGGGGGGGGYFPDNARTATNDTSVGGNGGSGVVIVRYSAPPPPPPPPEPAGAPRDVTGVAGDRSAAFSWKAPERSGSFPVTHFQLTLGPGGRTCVVAAPATTCRISGLTNGTAYTATVKALTGAGWGALSDPSPTVTPTPPPPPSISVFADRSERSAGVVSVRGSSTMLPAGTKLWVYVHERDPYGYVTRAPGTSNPVVAADGSFTWQRMINPANTFEVIWCTQPDKKGVCSPWTLL